MRVNSFFYTKTGTVMKYTAPASAYGSLPTYTTGSTYSCAIDSLSGNESIIAKKRSVESTHIVIMDYGADINEKDKIVIDSTTYLVLYVDNPLRRNEWLEIEVKIIV